MKEDKHPNSLIKMTKRNIILIIFVMIILYLIITGVPLLFMDTIPNQN